MRNIASSGRSRTPGVIGPAANQGSVRSAGRSARRTPPHSRFSQASTTSPARAPGMARRSASSRSRRTQQATVVSPSPAATMPP